MKKGKVYEDLAVDFLRKNKFKIIARNFKCRFGEIDIIAREKNTLCFIEVRKRKTNSLVTAVESVDRKKREKIKITSLFYLKQNKERFENLRYDVISLTQEKEKLNLDLIRGAFCFD